MGRDPRRFRAEIREEYQSTKYKTIKHMMTYKEQLESQEWKKKRNEILKRDNYHCQHCGKLGICGNSTNIYLSDLKELKNFIDKPSIYQAINTFLLEDIECNEKNKASDVEIWYGDEDYPIKKRKQWKLYPVSSILSNITPFYIFSMMSDIDLNDLYEFSIKKDSLSISILLHNHPLYAQTPVYLQTLGSNGKGIYAISYNNRSMVLLDRDSTLPLLDIHHKFYKENHLAWEYDNSNLITLCRDCHEKEHAAHGILLLDENDEPIEVCMCDRCGGTGYLPQYKYFQHGICFKCGGYGYLKL